VLQEYNAQKKLERWFKTTILRKSKTGISAVPCEPYCARFIEKMREITAEQISPAAASSFILTREAAITVDLGEVKAPPTAEPEGRDSQSVHPSPTHAQLGGENSRQHSLSQQPRISELGRESLPPVSFGQSFKSYGGGGSFRGGGGIPKLPSQRGVFELESPTA